MKYKYLLLIIAIVFTQFAVAQHAQKLGLRLGIGTLQFDDLMHRKATLGVELRNSMIIEVSMSSKFIKARNLPSDFKGSKPFERYAITQLNIGKPLSVAQNKKVRLVALGGLHLGTYSGVNNLVKKPEENSNSSGFLLLDVFSALLNSTRNNYTYDTYSKKLLGANGELLLECSLGKVFRFDIGVNAMANARKTTVGLSSKLIVQF